jgi:very-short-patch-repair endonuclease
MTEPSPHRPDEGSPPTGAPDSLRRETVTTAVDRWAERLIDLSRRNNLLYYRELKTGTLALSAARPNARAALDAFLSGKAVPVRDLLPPPTGLPDADEERTIAATNRAKVREIQRRALTNLEEKGLETLFVAMAHATWPSDDGGRPPCAPVFLIPAAIRARGSAGPDLSLIRTGDVQINPVLAYVLGRHGVPLDTDELLAAVPGAELDVEADVHWDFSAALARLKRLAAEMPAFRLEPALNLSNFSYQKMAMVHDLEANLDQLVASDIVAALAGHTPTRDALAASGTDMDPRELDTLPPTTEHLVLDADSSQQVALLGALAGQDMVIQGPPGTGKSQTIANLVCELAATGQRTLFVAEKRAALEVVQQRLEDVGLGHLTLDLHGASLSKRDVAARLGEALLHVRESLEPETAELFARFVDRRDKLNAHDQRLHAARPPSGLSVFDLQGLLLRTRPETRVDIRFRGPQLDRLAPEAAREMRDLLLKLSAFADIMLSAAPSPWRDAALDSGSDVQSTLDLLRELLRDSWPALAERLRPLRQALPNLKNLDDAARGVGLLEELERVFSDYPASVFAEDLPALQTALAPASRGALARAWALLTDAGYRRAGARLRRCKHERASTRVLLADVGHALNCIRTWTELGGTGEPRPVGEASQLRAQLAVVTETVKGLADVLGWPDALATPLERLEALLRALQADHTTPPRLPRYRALRREIDGAELNPLLKALVENNLNAEQWPEAFDYAYWASCLDRARSEDPELAAFDGRLHDRFAADFRGLDRERIAIESGRVARCHAERVVDTMNQYPDEALLVRREAIKKSRHLPLRRLLAEAPHALTALCPCWLASPLSVSQLLDGGKRYFDVVLFDEASQVTPESAVPALMRAEHAVVAGDRHQLPPTPFFAEQGFQPDADEEIATEGFESLLDSLSAFLPNKLLEWHYRSRDESLIAFSNRHIYHDRLVTFPGAETDAGISHVLVDQPDGIDGQEDSSDLEVRRVVDLVLKHAEQRQGETLGVITMGLRHARRVQAALDDALQLHPDLEEFFDIDRSERFFIKSIERVQGDEREAIILSVGYGKDRSGRLLYRFGPLLQEGGERRLNVAITRARRRMIVVSSFSHLDMDPARSSARGVELLRLYLQYAASDGRLLGDTSLTSVPLNAFEADVYDALSKVGIPLVPQLGVGRYRIDFGAQDTDQPGRFVLAIECDGATYHSSPTARDRDRLRQQHLEALGWRFHRIWSTDWFTRREQEVARALDAYTRARDRMIDTIRPHPPRPTPPASPSGAPARGPRPDVPRRGTIAEYRSRELDALVAWCLSDGRLRTDDEIITEMVGILGFQRRGRRIEKAVRRALERLRRQTWRWS